MSRASVGVVVSCPCGEVYELRPEYAGRLLECPACGRHLRAGPAASAPRPPTPGVDHAFDRDVFLLRERVFTITSKYEVWAENGTPVLYVERPTYPRGLPARRHRDRDHHGLGGRSPRSG